MFLYFNIPLTWKLVAFTFMLVLQVLSPVQAQEQEYYPYYSSDTTQLHLLAVAQHRSLKNHLVIPQNVSAAYRNSYKSIVESSAESAYRRVRNSALLDTIIEPYMQSVFKEVTSANKELAGAKLVLTRSPIENAYAMADGTIFFNIGLLAKLENESQVAFILCHELAHFRLSHMERGIKEHLDVMYSKDLKKQYRQVSREKYNRLSKMEAFYEEMNLGNMYHRRALEKQADSLGYLMHAKTKYNAADAFTALQVLEHRDDPHSTRELNFDKFFSCSDFKYNFSRMRGKPTSIFDVAGAASAYSDNPDTLQTHPDIQKRIGYLKELELTLTVTPGKQHFESARFASIKAICLREVVQSWFDTNNYDYALFNAMLLLEEQPGSNYLKNMVLLCLFDLKRHMQLHKYSDVVSVESESYSENFNHLLRVLHNLNASDFKGMGRCFAQATQPARQMDEYALAAQYALAALNNDAAAAALLEKTYFGRFKESRFGKDFFSTKFR